MSPFDLPELQAELDELTKQQHAEDFWMDQSNAQKVSQRAKAVENKINSYLSLEKKLTDVAELVEMADGDEELIEEAAADFEKLKKEVADLYISTLLRENTTAITQSFPFTRARAEPKRRIG